MGGVQNLTTFLLQDARRESQDAIREPRDGSRDSRGVSPEPGPLCMTAICVLCRVFVIRGGVCRYWSTPIPVFIPAFIPVYSGLLRFIPEFIPAIPVCFIVKNVKRLRKSWCLEHKKTEKTKHCRQLVASRELRGTTRDSRLASRIIFF